MKRIPLLIVLLLICASCVFARGKVQGTAVVSQSVVTAGTTSSNKFERVLASATITVYAPTGQTATKATLYSDRAGTPKGNDFTAGTDGSYFFYTDAASVDIRISGVTGVSAFTLSDIPVTSGDSVSTMACIGTNDTTALANANTAGGTIVIPKGITCASNSQTISAALKIDKGGLLKPITGQTVTLTGEQNKDTWQKFTNATTGLGTISFAGNKTLSEIYTEWWGATPDGSTDFTPYFNAAAAALPTNVPGINGGTIKLLIGNYRTTGITMPDKQINVIGSGGIGNVGGTCTAPTQITSITNATVIKYAWYVGTSSYRVRLENLAICANSTGTSQHGVWVDNGGIYINNVSINNIGGNGLLLSHTNGTSYSNLEIHNPGIDGIRIQPSVSSNASGGVGANTFHNISVGSAALTALHFLCGSGNSFYGLDFENNLGRGIWFDHECSQEVMDNAIYSYWDENQIGAAVEFAGASQSNYVQFTHPNYTPLVTANSPGYGNEADLSAVSGSPRKTFRGQVVVGVDAIQHQSPSGALTVTAGHADFLASDQCLRWNAAGLAQICVGTNLIKLRNIAGNADANVSAANATLSGTFSATGNATIQGALNYAADAGSTDDYAVTLSPAPAAYTAGMYIAFKANTANTGACTINVNGLGAKSLKLGVSTDPGNNFIKSGSIVLVVFDGTNFQMIQPAAQ